MGLEALLNAHSIRWELLMFLSKNYEEDYRRFVVIPVSLMEICSIRFAVAELRNDRYVEERVRGVIRLSPRGYLMCQKEMLGFDHCESE
jgi:hypothetical protein